MKNQLCAVLPPRLRSEVGEELWELRLRLGQATQLVGPWGSCWLRDTATEEELKWIVNTASRYSPWAVQTMSRGYLTAPGGHRIGLGGQVVVDRGQATGFREVDSLCIRVARDLPDLGKPFAGLPGSVLILGPPGAGKTTLLRDLCRQISQKETVAVVDERGELFPTGFYSGRRTDVLTGCSKQYGLEMVLRTMGPGCIAVDEITQEADCIALMQSSWCGVRILATAHAASLDDLKRRPIYKALWETKIFDAVVIMRTDKSWYTERIS